jgi:mRNA-degrading endonuclease RelE of RelBE toxin-antitoxin system
VTWSLRHAGRAKKALDKAPDKDQRLILSALESMRTDPFSGDIKRLKNDRTAWRRSVGNYRVFFDVHPDTSSLTW